MKLTMFYDLDLVHVDVFFSLLVGKIPIGNSFSLLSEEIHLKNY